MDWMTEVGGILLFVGLILFMVIAGSWVFVIGGLIAKAVINAIYEDDEEDDFL